MQVIAHASDKRSCRSSTSLADRRFGCCAHRVHVRVVCVCCSFPDENLLKYLHPQEVPEGYKPDEDED